MRKIDRSGVGLVISFATSTGVLVSACAFRGPQPISSCYDYPLRQDVLERFSREEKVHDLRLHAWNLWAGLNEQGGDGRPLWRSWWPSSVTLRNDTPSEFLEPARQLLESGAYARFSLAPAATLLPTAPTTPASADLGLMTTVYFNDTAHRFIRDNTLQCEATLRTMNQSFRGTLPVDRRQIPEFPSDAVALKATWLLVRKHGVTLLPVWRRDFSCNTPGPAPLPTQWKEHLWISAEPWEGDRVVPLDRFYSVPLDTPELVRQANNSMVFTPSRPVESGDSIVLIGMHVATKEMRDWFWATFWWDESAELNTPDDLKEFAADRPDAVKDCWRSFLMDTTGDAERPLEPLDPQLPPDSDRRNICFNPWLEGPLTSGVCSNCVACHQYARWQQGPPLIQRTFISRGYTSRSDTKFEKAIRLDYIWSLNRFPDSVDDGH